MLEILTVLMGETVSNFEEYRITDGSRAYAANHKKIYLWILFLQAEFSLKNPHVAMFDEDCLRIQLAIVATLLDRDPKYRPLASELVGSVESVGCDHITNGKPYCYGLILNRRPVTFHWSISPEFGSLDDYDKELPHVIEHRTWLVPYYLFEREKQKKEDYIRKRDETIRKREDLIRKQEDLIQKRKDLIQNHSERIREAQAWVQQISPQLEVTDDGTI